VEQGHVMIRRFPHVVLHFVVVQTKGVVATSSLAILQPIHYVVLTVLRVLQTQFVVTMKMLHMAVHRKELFVVLGLPISQLPISRLSVCLQQILVVVLNAAILLQEKLVVLH